jgi:hypothetical protein
VIHLQIWPVFPTQDQMDISKQIGRIVNRFGLAAVRVGTPGRSITSLLQKPQNLPSEYKTPMRFSGAGGLCGIHFRKKKRALLKVVS